MKRFVLVVSALAALSVGTPSPALAWWSIGGGLHYLHNLADIEEEGVDWKNDNFGIIAPSVQFGLGPLVTLEGNLEFMFDYLGSDETLTEPSAYALIGGLIYGGLGIGIGHINDDWQSDPFYALRGGVQFGLGGLNLDTYATYRFQSDEELEDLTGEDLDSLTFAAVLRKSFGVL